MVQNTANVATDSKGIVAGSRADSAGKASRSPTDRLKSRTACRTTNGAVIVAGIDGRSVDARRLRDLSASFIEGLGGSPSPIEREQVRVAALAQLNFERMSAAAASGEPVSSDELTRAGNAAARALNALQAARRRQQPRSRPSNAIDRMREQIMAGRMP